MAILLSSNTIFTWDVFQIEFVEKILSRTIRLYICRIYSLLFRWMFRSLTNERLLLITNLIWPISFVHETIAVSLRNIVYSILIENSIVRYYLESIDSTASIIINKLTRVNIFFPFILSRFRCIFGNVESFLFSTYGFY